DIVVLQPGVGQNVRSPIAVGGYARLFEAAGNFELRNATGQIIASGTFQAAVGQEFARYDFNVPFTTTIQQAGTLSVFSVSPKDGSRINVVTVPLTLSP